MSASIQAYLRTSAARDRVVERAGPFLATFTEHSANPYLNYAIPDDGTEPTPGQIADLIAMFERRNRTPRLEYLPGLSPAVEPALAGAGFTVEERLPLMHCPPGGTVEQPVPDGYELLEPITDDDFLGMLSAQHEAFDDPEPITDKHVAGSRKLVAAGGFAVYARVAETGEAAGAGVSTALRDGFTEVAGIAVREPHRKRGLAGAITLDLTRRAHAAGATTVFLTPAGDPQERMYARVGYRRTDSILFLIKRAEGAS